MSFSAGIFNSLNKNSAIASDKAGPTASSDKRCIEGSDTVVLLKIASASLCLDGADGAVNSKT